MQKAPFLLMIFKHIYNISKSSPAARRTGLRPIKARITLAKFQSHHQL